MIRSILTKALGALLCCSLLFACATTSYAAGWPTPAAEIQAEGAILIDADTGVMLYGKNQDTPYYPASITKVMTAIIVLEQVSNLDEMITYSNAAVNENLEENATITGALAGDQLSVRDSLYCLLLQSANDAANALAEHVAGSNEAFAELMNQKAAELGCTNTHFNNPSGLNNPDHYTSSSDMAKIMAYAIKNPLFRQIDQTQYYTHGPLKRYPDPKDPVNTIYAHHKMMRKNAPEYYSGVFAGKTGYTMAAGNTLVTACERNGMTLICVILNGHRTQYSDTKTLFDYGFENFSSLAVSEQDSAYGALGNTLSVDGIPLPETLTPQIDADSRITLPKTAAFSEAVPNLSYDLSDAERADGAIAKIDYSYEEQNVGSAYVRFANASAQDDALVQAASAQLAESSAQESIPESINLPDAGSSASNQATNADTSLQSHAPLRFDRASGKLIVPPVLIKVVLVLAVIFLFSFLGYGIFWLWERRAERARKRRRARIMKRTQDLTLEQQARREALLKQRRQNRARSRKRR